MTGEDRGGGGGDGRLGFRPPGRPRGGDSRSGEEGGPVASKRMLLGLRSRSTLYILQNIAARNPLLSGHLRSQPLDQSFQSILAVRFTIAFLTDLALPLAALADLRACIVRGPPFGERSSVSRVCLQGGGERRGGCAGCLVRWPRATLYFRVSFCFQGLWRGRPWRPSLRRWVRGTPVIAEPSLGHGERSDLAATHSRFLFFPFLLLPFLNPSRRHPSPTPILRRIRGLSPTAREGGRRRATPRWRPAAEQ
jgi:hypothetical protein